MFLDAEWAATTANLAFMVTDVGSRLEGGNIKTCRMRQAVDQGSRSPASRPITVNVVEDSGLTGSMVFARVSGANVSIAREGGGARVSTGRDPWDSDRSLVCDRV